jgi:uncharacterized protein DUF1344
MRWRVPARAVLVLLISVAPAVSGAQSPIPPGTPRPVAPTGPTVENQEVEGLIRRVDPAARTITLDNGQDYYVPAALLDLAGLQAGLNVKLRFGVDGGRNYTTALQVRP